MASVGEARLFVLRHGERADACKSASWEDHLYPYDPPLTPTGHEQAKEAGARISSLLPSGGSVRVVCSPFMRCLQTATHVADSLGAPRIELVPQLADILSEHGFIYSDVRWRWVDKQIDPGAHLIDTDRFQCQPDAVYPVYRETMDAAAARMRQAFLSLRDRHPTESLVAVCHWYSLEVAAGLSSSSVQTLSAGYCAALQLRTADWTLLSSHNVK